MAEPCVVCRRRPPARGRVCNPDFTAISEQLAAVVRRFVELSTRIVPDVLAAQERVTTSVVDAPLPVRVDALSLTGPGSEDTEWAPARTVLHPLVRRWRTAVPVVVTRRSPAGKRIRELRHVVVWHRELARDNAGYPVYIDNGDQVGLVPPAEWLDAWARRFRRVFGHSVPARTVRRPAPRVDVVAAVRTYHGARLVAWYAAVRTAWRRHAARTAVGLIDGYGGLLPPSARPDDPVAEELGLRFGSLTRHPAAADARYLIAWLDAACAHPGIDIAAMAGELRALAAELARVCGDRTDQQWIGRCPAVLTDRATGTDRLCGAGLWQDPYTGQYVDGHHCADGQIRCPRCHSTWGPGRLALVALARDIRTAWPLDRRRRYNADDRAAMAARCPTCTRELQVRWRETTAPGDRARTWQPDTITCPGGCDDGCNDNDGTGRKL